MGPNALPVPRQMYELPPPTSFADQAVSAAIVNAPGNMSDVSESDSSELHSSNHNYSSFVSGDEDSGCRRKINESTLSDDNKNDSVNSIHSYFNSCTAAI